MIRFTKRPVVALGVLGVMGGFAPVACKAQADKPLPVAGIGGPRTWSAQADGFASLEALGQKGTTGGEGGQVVTVDNLADLEKYAAAPEPYVILIKGTIDKEPFGKNIKVTSNKTLLGLGDDATILHGELHLDTVQNVIIRNLTIKDSWVPDDPNGKKFDYDAIQIDNSHHIWIDHCTLTHMEDGLIDLRKKSDYVTVSWCVLSNHNKAFGIGWYPEEGSLHVTIHHNWIHNTTQRNPSFDNGTGHLYNNYLEDIGSYGNYSRGKSKLVVENSYFEKVNNPLICGPEAEMVVHGNIVKDSPTTDEAQSKPKGTAFDPSKLYSYRLDPTETVPALLEKFSGPQANIGVAPTKAGVPVAALATHWNANAQVALKHEIVVAADGTGDYKTLQEAIAAVPDKSEARTILHIKPGTYQGQIMVPASKTNISFIGDDVEKTILTYAYNTNEENPGGIEQRYKGTSVVVLADGFQARNITFQNASGDHGQALALRIDGDKAIVTDCRLLGWQDTLMLNKGRQYFTNTYIEGRVDFIYGSGTALFEKCEIRSKNGGHITAASTPQEQPYGFVFRDCDLTEDPKPWVDPATGQPPAGRKMNALADLGRPWRPYGSVTYLNCRMGSHILPAGWNNWGKPENEQTTRYSEFGSVTPDGKPVDVSARVAWSKKLTAEEAATYTTEKVLNGWQPAPEIAAMPRPFFALAGDSTVTDDAGWGAGFKALLKPGVSLTNLARGGRSSKSFRAEGRWQQTLALKPEYVLIQFGHNDEPGHGPDRETDPATTYRQNLEQDIDEARAAGATPILVTPLTRRQFDATGKIKSSLAPYAATVQAIAAAKKVPVIDLHARSLEVFDKLGPTGWQSYAPPKETGAFDGTHLNASGSALVAPLVVQELCKAEPQLAVYFR